jgi:hypothetical protein
MFHKLGISLYAGFPKYPHTNLRDKKPAAEPAMKGPMAKLQVGRMEGSGVSPSRRSDTKN